MSTMKPVVVPKQRNIQNSGDILNIRKGKLLNFVKHRNNRNSDDIQNIHKDKPQNNVPPKLPNIQNDLNTKTGTGVGNREGSIGLRQIDGYKWHFPGFFLLFIDRKWHFPGLSPQQGSTLNETKDSHRTHLGHDKHTVWPYVPPTTLGIQIGFFWNRIVSPSEYIKEEFRKGH